MPWRRPRKRVESAREIKRSEEEALEEKAEHVEEDEAVELAALDGASIVEAATGEPEDDRVPSDLAAKLGAAVEGVDLPALSDRSPVTRRIRPMPQSEEMPKPSSKTSPARPEDGVDLEVEVARGLRLKNPVLTASGTFGQGTEYAELIDVARLGAIVNKGTTARSRPGNKQYRIAETPSGILNSIGLENPGAAAVAKKYGKAWAELGVPVVVNVAGYSVSDYVTVVREMEGTPGVVAYELNVSCPNVDGGLLFGCDPGLAADVTRAVKAETDKPVIVKLTPNAPDVVAVARACEDAGADGLTAINTVMSVTALHNHFFFDKPRVMFMHIGGEGTVEQLAAGVKAAFAKQKEIRAKHADPAQYCQMPFAPAGNAITGTLVEETLGVKGQAKDGMFKVVIGRSTKMPCGCEMTKEMGVNTWAAFGGTDDNAAVAGDFAVLEDELQPVLKALRAGKINIVAIHSHMTHENPRILFLHFWGKGKTVALAQGLKRALDVTKN